MPQVKKVYTPDDLALFARYREVRSNHRPRGCVMASSEVLETLSCWVEIGPPGLTTEGICIACHGRPRFIPIKGDK